MRTASDQSRRQLTPVTLVVNHNALALLSNERVLLVSHGGENAIDVVRLGNRASHPAIVTVKDAEQGNQAHGIRPGVRATP